MFGLCQSIGFTTEGTFSESGSVIETEPKKGPTEDYSQVKHRIYNTHL